MNNDSDKPMTSENPEMNRRYFLSGLGVALSGLIGLFFVFPLVGYLLRPLWRKVTPEWRDVGAVDSFEVGTTVKVTFTNASPHPWAGDVGKSAAWLRRVSEDEFIAFSVNCTHLGCPVRWVGHANLFMCPCHGSVFYNDGRVAAGPAPRPMARYTVRVRNGQVEVQTGPVPISTTT